MLTSEDEHGTTIYHLDSLTGERHMMCVLFQGQFGRLAHQAALLEDIASRRIRMRVRQHGGSAPSYAPIPVNLEAMDMLDTIEHETVRFAHEAGLQFSRGTSVHALLNALRRERNCLVLTDHEDRDELLYSAAKLTEQARHITDPDPHRKYVGVCTNCRHGLWIAETRRMEGDCRCLNCGHINDLREVLQGTRARLLVCGLEGTAAELAKLLTGCGIKVNRLTIAQWKKRGHLQPVAQSREGYPIYALADVLHLARAFDQDQE